MIWKHRCGRQAVFIVEAPKLRQMCSHHAAIAEALGWKVYNVRNPGVPPAYDAPRPAQKIA
jgi:hypothetical protein